MLVELSHFSVLTLDRMAEGAIVLPGAAQAPDDLKLGTTQPESLGYVRSQLLVADAWKSRTNSWEPEDQAAGAPDHRPRLPFRDYPSSLRVPVASITANRRNLLVISARNVLNEFRYQARISGTLYRAARDVDLPGEWPVLCVARSKPQTFTFRTFGDATDDVDFVSGVPLVINGRPSSRSFLVANSSDCAHSFQVDPNDRFGPPGAWLPISDQWNRLHSRRLAGEVMGDDEFAAAVDQVAARFQLPIGPQSPGQIMPHSIVAERQDRTLQFMVISTSLPGAARFLAGQGFRNAIVLDQSGSVGHSYVDELGRSRTLVSTSNYRDSGTCFLLISTGSYLGVARHFLVPT